MSDPRPDLHAPSRRSFLVGSQLLLSGAAISLMSGLPTRAFAGRRGAQPADITVLNTAIAAEHEAVAAYQLGAESGLLTSEVLPVAVAFQGHHKEHIDALAKAVRELGGIPAEPKAAYSFPVSQLTDQTAVLTSPRRTTARAPPPPSTSARVRHSRSRSASPPSSSAAP